MTGASPAELLRQGDAALLDSALVESRAATLRTFAAYQRGLAATGLGVDYSDQLNPPLWELGHVGWFQEFWLGRNRDRALGVSGDPDAPRAAASLLEGADGLYDSSHVEHTRRWQLALPDVEGTLNYLARVLAQSRELLARERGSPGVRYFTWLVLMHEDMHREAATYMAQALGFEPEAGLDPLAPLPPGEPEQLELPAALHTLGAAGPGFAFDNELPPQQLTVDSFRIDRYPVSNARFGEFVDAGGYGRADHWTTDGWTWRIQSALAAPRYWRRGAGGFEALRHGRWEPLDLHAPAVHLTLYEAQAFCHWAGRRLPTEPEWERAATAAPLVWGEVWEWTATPFAPYPGFVPHPYRDYSQPWFGSRQVLRGACAATSPRLRHPRFRNFFTPERNDVFSGFRTCACSR